MVGNNTPVFFIREPLKFPDFIHNQKRDPSTNLKNPDMFRDFLSLTPESIHEVSILFPGQDAPGGHLFSYHDTHRHRLGPNYHLLRVNASNPFG